MQSIYGAGVLVHGHTDGVLGQSIPKSNGAHQRAPRPLVLHHIHSIKSVNLHVDCDRMRPGNLSLRGGRLMLRPELGRTEII